ncbi:MAG: hypothetical protein J1E99_00040 [Muribaculaceae bacterium]|nr:hypothetical protein [Muribaculaceae bacterium]
MADSPVEVNSNNLPKNQVVAHRGYWNREGGTQNDLQSYKETIALGVSVPKPMLG